MSILNVNQIQPVGSGQTITVSATDITASSSTISANSFSGNVTGNINATGISTFNVITGVSTIGVTTIHVTGINDLTYPTAGPLGRRNLIINGRFDFWQRGTSFTGGEYTADRWFQALSGGTSTVSRQSFTLGQTEVPGNPVYYLQQSCSVGNGNCGINQKIEDVRTGAGGPVTVSFWAKGTNPPGYGYWAMQLWQRFGTGGSPSATVENNKELTVTSEWKKYTFTYELESVSGKTLGDDNNHNVDLIIRQHADDDDTGAWELNLANVQVEFGRNATEFEHRSYGEELALCQRYYYKTIGDDEYETIAWAGHFNTTYQYIVVTFPTSMRTEPAVDLGGDLRIVYYDDGSTQNNSTDIWSIGNVQLGNNGGYFRLDTDGSWANKTAGTFIRVDKDNDANAFFDFDSEL